MKVDTYPKNLAQLKRFLVPNRKLRLVFHHLKGAVDEVRSVVKKTASAVAFCVPGETSASWLEWPNAGRLRFEDEGFSILDANGNSLMRYAWVDQSDGA